MSRQKDYSNELVEVSGELRQDRAVSWAIWTGEMEQGTNGQEREKWIFLPKKLCQQGDNPTTWLVPQFIAYEKGLI